MFWEVLITAIVFGSILGAIKMLLDYRRDKNQVHAAATGEPSLTTSELRALIAEAVEEVVDRRLNQLEMRLEERETPRLMPASTGGLEDVELDHPAAPLVPRDREATQ